ncbi:hypothetical protein UG54_00070 [Gordonia sihwensis]|nr:hypothetical protein UG54_00070 [Gordonia sihwensis]
MKIPAPIGPFTAFLAKIDDAGGCSDALVDGITDTIGALNVYGTSNAAGTAEVTGHTDSRIEGVPTCTFTIDAGNTEFPTKLIIGGLPQDRNPIVSTPPPPTTPGDEYTSKSDKPCPLQITDKVSAAAAQILKDNNAAALTCAENTSATGSLSVDTQPVGMTGRAASYGNTTDGFFVVAVDPNASRFGLTSSFTGTIVNWFDRESTPGNATNYTDGS